MSRIGNKPIPIPSGVKVQLAGQTVSVKGKLGELTYELRPEVGIAVDEPAQSIKVTRQRDDRLSRALHGLTRSLIRNMVDGVSQGFEKKLEIVGVGYGAFLQGSQLQLRLGYANEVCKTVPPGLSVTCPDQMHIVVKGCDKQMVGQFAAEIRAARKPEPYKGKGVRYEGEQVRRKAGKTAK